MDNIVNRILARDLKEITLREEQTKCLDAVFNEIQNKDTKFFLLDLPTGVGKSIFTLSFIQRYLSEIDNLSNFDLITESKLLQKQYADEFKSITNLSGRNTYTCKPYNTDCDKGKAFAAITEEKCEDCPYLAARDRYMGGNISLTNFHMYIVLRISGLLREMRKSNILIVDEAHELESVFSEYISLNISNYSLRKMKMENFTIESILNDVKNIHTVEEFTDYYTSKLSKILSNQQDILEASILNNRKSIVRDIVYDSIINESNEEKSEQVKIVAAIEEIESFTKKFENFIEDYTENAKNWVIEREYDSESKKFKLMLQPIWVHNHFDKEIWNRYDKVLLMSGTILNKDIFCYINGIEPDKAFYYRINSPFSANKRPIYYTPTEKFNFSKKKEAFEYTKPILKNIIDKYSKYKGIVHTVTFEFQNMLLEHVPSDRYLTHESNNDSKKIALHKHYTGTEPTILVSPSMGTGIDLKGDRARFQILLKVPYPSLGSIKNKQRLETKPEWYQWITIAKFIQIYGRAIRSKDDSAHFYIFDKCFSDLLRSSYLFPDWVLSAIEYNDYYLKNKY